MNKWNKKGRVIPTIDDYFKRSDLYPELIKRFENKEEAYAELAKYKCSYRVQGSYNWDLTLTDLYWVEEVIYDVDEDGELDWVDAPGMDFAEWEEKEITEEMQGDDEYFRRKYNI